MEDKQNKQNADKSAIVGISIEGKVAYKNDAKTIKFVHKTGDSTFSYEGLLNDTIIDYLVSNNIATPLYENKTSQKKECQTNFIAQCIKNRDYHLIAKEVIEYINKRTEWSDKQVKKIFHTLNMVASLSVISLILKATAIILDKQYIDHISKAKEIYSIDTNDGSIYMLDDINEISWQITAAFRSKEDAELAIVILKGLTDYYFNDK